MTANERYEEWLKKLDREDPLYAELKAIEGDEAEITDRFYQDIVFGTAGLRGVCGAGTNRMNVLTVGRATQGIADYILSSGEDPLRGVAIAYDCRYHSKEFSCLAAEILAGNGIRAYLFPSLRPTPELSFAIRELGAISGINMTASHNPKEYNGYKVYWKDGAQISGEVSDGMQDKIGALDLFGRPGRMPLSEAMQTSGADGKPLAIMLGEHMDRAYLDYVESMAQHPDEELDLAVPVVYTPLNGAGSIPMTRVAEERGFTGYRIVSEQKDPDPEFTTVPFPNPENPRAFELAERLACECGAEVIVATDPDADRMAVEIADARANPGSYIYLNGNQTGAMLIAYLAESMKERGTLPGKAVMIKSIVTGDFGRAICESFGIRVVEALTGFKNICGKIPGAEEAGYTYFFGYEESIGCAPGVKVRDKDGICAGMLIMEMAAYYRRQGRHLLDVLNGLYEKYGYFAEDAQSLVLAGREGQEKIGRIMERFRKEPPERFGALELARKIDYIGGLRGETKLDDIPAQNALKFVMKDGSWFAMRPSGTEPKLKFYYYAAAGSMEESGRRIREMKDAVNAYFE